MNNQQIPAWIDVVVIPTFNILVAFLVSALVFWYIDISPLDAISVMWQGAFGYDEGIGYTLYYTTGFIFTGLAVAIAFHAGLFNIGGEGQAYIGGLGVAIICLWLSDWPFLLVFPLAILAAALFGAGWAFIPAYLQAKRGSHIVITTIMFNFIAASLMAFMLVNVLKAKGGMAVESERFSANVVIPKISDILNNFGFSVANSPLNLSIFFALICCVFFWFFLWHTKWGYEIRSVGANSSAAVYGGIKNNRVIIITMLLSGMFAGFFALNVVQGNLHQLRLNYVEGFGFTGIAIALMGRNHPVGIVLASLLFGFLYQGGAELSFEFGVDRNIVVVLQGLVILFSGAMQYMFKHPIEQAYLFLLNLFSKNKEASS